MKELNEINDDDMILDIGEKTIKKIENLINSSKTVLWNGPAGYFENSDFANGSYEIAKLSIVKIINQTLFIQLQVGVIQFQYLNKIKFN